MAPRSGVERSKIARVRLAISIAAAVLAAAPAQAASDHVDWSGPGYYVEDILLEVYAGPFASKSDCEAAIGANAAPDAQHAFVCSYYSSQQDFAEAHP